MIKVPKDYKKRAPADKQSGAGQERRPAYRANKRVRARAPGPGIRSGKSERPEPVAVNMQSRGSRVHGWKAHVRNVGSVSLGQQVAPNNKRTPARRLRGDAGVLPPDVRTSVRRFPDPVAGRRQPLRVKGRRLRMRIHGCRGLAPDRCRSSNNKCGSGLFKPGQTPAEAGERGIEYER
jgi:hypothetical protein